MQDLFIERPGYIQVSTTVETPEQAEKIADRLVEAKLAACVQMVTGVRSVYYWQGKKERSEEVILLIKTKMDIYGKLARELKKLHPYELPEIIVTPIVEGNTDYFNWIDENTDG